MHNYVWDKFAVFSTGRSGSNTLMKIISSTGIQCCHEPFIYEKIANTKDALIILKKKLPFDGIKTLHYQLNEDMHLKILNQFSKIIYLKRKNYLQAAISHLISIQTLSWEYYKPMFQPLELNLIEWYINESKKMDAIIGNLKNTKTILYEDLFGENKIDVVENIFKFLRIDSPITDEINYLLSSQHKVNPESTYVNIPNLKDIIKRFGSPYSNKIKFN